MDFVEVIRAQQRMCETVGDCENCPMNHFHCWPNGCENEEELREYEECVMNWAHNYPEPIYPTIRELVNYIMNKIPGESVSYETRIPANIAKEFNILPINEGTLTKKEK